MMPEVAGWLAGVLEGDGTFCITNPGTHVAELRLGMSDLDIVAHTADLWGGKVYDATYDHRKKQYRTICPRGNLIAVLSQILPHLVGKRRKGQALTLLALQKTMDQSHGGKELPAELLEYRGWLKQLNREITHA